VHGHSSNYVPCFAVFILAIPRNTMAAIAKFCPKRLFLSSLALLSEQGGNVFQFYYMKIESRVEKFWELF
jgi:hypothetical protein